MKQIHQRLVTAEKKARSNAGKRTAQESALLLFPSFLWELRHGCLPDPGSKRTRVWAFLGHQYRENRPGYPDHLFSVDSGLSV
jgi:hypothetical protein